MTEIPVRPASTVVLLREGEGGPETLLLRRNKALAFAGGFWVFPGGAVDEADRAGCESDDARAAKRAAVREAEEEAGLAPDPDSLVLVSHWTTPVAEKKRFSTWIFAAAVTGDSEARIDGSEIHDAAWIGIRAALEQHAHGELPMLPPTYITLCALARYDTVAQAIEGERDSPCPEVIPLLLPLDSPGAFITVYPGDVAYDGADPDTPGPRHRAFLENNGWRYIYHDVDDAPPLYPLQGPASEL